MAGYSPSAPERRAQAASATPGAGTARRLDAAQGSRSRRRARQCECRLTRDIRLQTGTGHSRSTWVYAPRSRCEQICAARQGEHGAAERQQLDELRSTRRRHSHTHAVSDTGFGVLFMQQATAVECTLYTSSGAGCPHRRARHHMCTERAHPRDVRTATILSRCPLWSQASAEKMRPRSGKALPRGPGCRRPAAGRDLVWALRRSDAGRFRPTSRPDRRDPGRKDLGVGNTVGVRVSFAHD